MRLSQIRNFLAVVESGGIRAAARKLGVSQPAITRSVRRLETDLHARLLQRTPTGVVLTKPGRAFLAGRGPRKPNCAKPKKRSTSWVKGWARSSSACHRL